MQRATHVGLALIGCLILVLGTLPVVVRSSQEEIAHEDVQATAGWQPIEREGLRMRLPPGWYELFDQGGVQGLSSSAFAAPICAEQATPGCMPDPDGKPMLFDVTVERIENRSTPPGDEVRDWLEERGMPRRSITLRGLPGDSFTLAINPDSSIQIVTLEHRGAYYRLRLDQGSALRDEDREIMALILGTLELLPETAPPPFGVAAAELPTSTIRPSPDSDVARTATTAIAGEAPTTPASAATLTPVTTVTTESSPIPTDTVSTPPTMAATATAPANDPATATPAIEATATAPANGPVSAADQQIFLPIIQAAGSAVATLPTTPRAITLAEVAVRYNAEDAAQYGWDNGGISWNSDECYIYTDPGNNTARCGADAVHTLAQDGAHFVDCALKAGGLATALCQGTDSYLRMLPLRDMLLSLPHRQFTNVAEAQPGDIFIASDNGIYCWGGIIISTEGGVRAATHSIDSVEINPEAVTCDTTTWRRANVEYIHIIGDTTPPVATFTTVPGRVAPGALTVQYDASDDASGVRDFTLEQVVKGGARTLVVNQGGAREANVLLDLPCRAVTFELTARDNADNVSAMVSLELFVSMRGDANGDDLIDAADLAAAEAAWGLTFGHPDFSAVLDVNADNRIDAADTLWIARHLGDRCEGK